MSAARPTFGRVDALVALVELLNNSAFVDGVQVSDAWQELEAENEAIWCGDLAGMIEQTSYMGTRPTIDTDDFVIPVHVTAGAVAAQQTSLDARIRCEQLMNGIRQTIATKKTLDNVPGLMFVTNSGADGPNAYAADEGWIANATVEVAVKIRMQ